MEIGNLFAEASQNAGRVDFDFLVLTIISFAILLLIFVLVIVFCVRYRRGSPAKRGRLPAILQREIEIGYVTGTVFLALFIFWWAVAAPAASQGHSEPALEIHISAKQWMWKVEHPNGAREIDTLHLPVDTPVHLLMTSQDVIHSFFVPEFRTKQDVLPGRVVELEFVPTKMGTFHLFCAEFCGTEHSQMTGKVIVMRQQDYARWREVQPQTDTLAAEGEALFHSLGCSGCHDPASPIHAPDLRGVFGHSVPLQTGRQVIADEAYVRDSILLPDKDIVAGYAPIMPSFSNVVNESQMESLLAYIRSLSVQASAQ
jgi:cytochrome c oxidase subunit 2